MAAIAGSAPSYPTPASNLVSFLFSQPFSQSSRYHTPDHSIPPIPQSKPILINASTGAAVTYARLQNDMLRIATGFREIGLSPKPYQAGQQAVVGPLILFHLPNCLAFTILKLGALAANLTVTMANSALTPPELAYIISSSKPDIIITQAGPAGVFIVDTAIANLNNTLQRQYASPNRIFTVSLDADDYGATPAKVENSLLRSNVQDWKQLLAPKPAEIAPMSAEECANRAAFILCSSGTSGKSKGVVLSHKAMISGTIATWIGNPEFTANEVFIGFVPFFHIFGLSNVELLGIAAGASIVVMSKFDPHNLLQLAQTYRATHLHMAPPVAVILAKSPMIDSYDLSSVTGATSGGAPLGADVIRQVYRRLNFFIKMGYGLSECSGVTSMQVRTWEEMEKVLGSTGTPFGGVQLKIVAVDNSSKVLELGVPGEILVKSPGNFSCYLNNPDATNESLDSEGWFHTGDVGSLDNAGNLTISDRLKEVIKVRGFQVAPSDLEAYLCSHPLVADAGVTSVYSEEEATEYPIGYVVAKDVELLKSSQSLGRACPKTLDFVRELNKYIESKTINYKWIKGGIVLVDAIPKSNSGKILRRLLKDCKGIHVQLYQPKKRAEIKAKL